jgi:uncharacterized membrane protein YhaH (DUF805 family)
MVVRADIETQEFVWAWMTFILSLSVIVAEGYMIYRVCKNKQSIVLHRTLTYCLAHVLHLTVAVSLCMVPLLVVYSSVGLRDIVYAEIVTYWIVVLSTVLVMLHNIPEPPGAADYKHVYEQPAQPPGPLPGPLPGPPPNIPVPPAAPQHPGHRGRRAPEPGHHSLRDPQEDMIREGVKGSLWLAATAATNMFYWMWCVVVILCAVLTLVQIIVPASFNVSPDDPVLLSLLLFGVVTFMFVLLATASHGIIMARARDRASNVVSAIVRVCLMGAITMLLVLVDPVRTCGTDSHASRTVLKRCFLWTMFRCIGVGTNLPYITLMKQLSP